MCSAKERDDSTGFYYHGARYYAPWIGRWMSADPAGPVDGLNLYVYVSGNPVRKIDPGGTEENDEIDMVFTTNEQEEMIFTPKEVEEYQKADTAKPVKEDIGYMEFTLDETTDDKTEARAESGKQSKDTEGTTLGISLGANVSGGIISYNLNFRILEDFISGDIGFSITRDKSGTAGSIEAGVQGSVMGFNTSVEAAVFSTDTTVSAGLDFPETDIGGGFVYSNLSDEDANIVGHGGGINASIGVSGEGNPVDIQVGSTQEVISFGKVNMPAVYEEAINIMTDFFEDPAETFYKNYIDIAPRIDIFGIMD